MSPTRRKRTRCCTAKDSLGDAGYHRVEKRDGNLGKSVTWHVAIKRFKRKALPNNELGRVMDKLKHLKASVRA